MESQELDFTIKEEIEPMHQDTEDIKTETSDPDNPFINIQLEVKQENLENSTIVTIQTCLNPTSDDNADDSYLPEDVASNKRIKEELQNDAMVAFDYPSFDDSASIDSDDATALGNVEACLQEEYNIKPESDVYEDPQKDITDMEVKTELTETNIQPLNDFKSETDTQSVPTGLIVVNNMDKNITPEEIVPTISNGALDYDDSGMQDDMLDEDMSYDDIDTKPDLKPNVNDCDTSMKDLEGFQLNSITGNILSLEQEAYIQASEKERPFICTECPKRYKLKSSLNKHMEAHRSIERRRQGHINAWKTIRARKKKLPLTKRNFAYVTDDEIETEIKGYDCTCGKVFQRRSRMETCLRSHDLFETSSNCVSCMTCTKQFKNKDELALHRKRLHRKKFPCKFCPTAYDTRKGLFKHLQDHQKVQLMEYKVISEVVNGNQKLCCFMCSITCTDWSELKTHVMTEHKGPYTCSHCSQNFPKIIDFANHTKTSHPEVEGQSVLDVLEACSKLAQAWKCQECDLQFLEPDKLALHEAEAHSLQKSAEPQFQCDDCRRVFLSQKGLTSHRRVHHSESFEEPNVLPDGIMCLECRKICKDIIALTSHMRLHSPDRKYPCKFCDFRFATPEKRKAHAEVHTGDMRYVCFICEYQCSSENRLKKHKMSLKHANIKEYLLTGKPLIEETKEEKKVTEEKKIESDSDSGSVSDSGVACDVCGETFPDSSEMQTHKETHPFIEIPSSGDNPTRIFFK